MGSDAQVEFVDEVEEVIDGGGFPRALELRRVCWFAVDGQRTLPTTMVASVTVITCGFDIDD